MAPVIIKNCKEEFQNIVDLKEPIVMGSMAVGMKEHPLLKVKQDFLSMIYFLSE